MFRLFLIFLFIPSISFAIPPSPPVPALVEGVDYVAPDGDGSGLTGITAETNLTGSIEITDTFASANNEWEKLAANVASTVSLSVGEFVITATGDNLEDSGWGNRNSLGRNLIMSIDIKGSPNHDDPSFHVRESADLFLMPHIDTTASTLEIGYFNTTFTGDVDTDAIEGYAASGDYTIITKVWENHISAYLVDAGALVSSVDYTDATVESTFTGDRNGIGTATDHINKYDNYSGKVIDSFVNVVFLGDSLTKRNVTTHRPYFPERVAQNFLTDPIAFVNSGNAGDSSNDIHTAIAARLTDKRVDNARNICFLLAGTNDFNVDNLAAAANAWGDANYLEDLIDLVLADNWELVVMTVPPKNDVTGWTGDGTATVAELNQEIKDLNELIKENADSKGYRVIDLYSGFVDSSDDDLYDSTLYTDNTHFNAAGNQAVADKIINFLWGPAREESIIDRASLNFNLLYLTKDWPAVVGTNVMATFHSFTDQPRIQFKRALGTKAVPTAITSGQSLGQILWQSRGATGYSGNQAAIFASATENHTDAAKGTSVVIMTTPNTTTSLAAAVTIGNDKVITAHGLTGTYIGGIAYVCVSDAGVISACDD